MFGAINNIPRKLMTLMKLFSAGAVSPTFGLVLSRFLMFPKVKSTGFFMSNFFFGETKTSFDRVESSKFKL